MFASPFFTSGRSAILPSIATKEELHTANTLTQTTQWTTLTLGGFFAGLAVKQFGYEWAFVLNSLSFAFSAWCILRLRVPESGQGSQSRSHSRKWTGYVPGVNIAKACDTCARSRCCLAIAMVHVGWATGGGAAQILFGLFGEIVFKMGSVGIGTIWSLRGRGTG